MKISSKERKSLTRAINILYITVSITLLTFITTSAQDTLNLTDSEISNAVENELLVNEDIGFYSIDVLTKNAIVILDGTTNNLFEKNKTTEITKAVKGVRGVVNLITVEDLVITDEQLEKSILDAILLNSTTEHFEIDVEAIDGKVILKGTVDSWQEKKIAKKVASNVVGVKEVENKIVFLPSEMRSDYDIEKDIKSIVRNDIRLDDGLMEVSVEEGKVFLSGTIGSLEEKDWAFYNAWVEGVSLVDTTSLEVDVLKRNENLRANKYATRSDSEISKAIQDAFFYDPRVKLFELTVIVDDGMVLLNGKVDNLTAKKAAESTARNVVGVSMVKNFIKVNRENIPDNNLLEQRVKKALALSSVAYQGEYEVKATYGLITLKGLVESQMEKILAEDVVDDVKGVVHVRNQLKVIQSYNSKDEVDVNWIDWYRANSANMPIEDKYIKKEIAYQFDWSPYIDREDIKISVEDGVATLTGTVGSLREKQQITVNALEGGAISVKNNTVIQYNDSDEN